MQAKTFDNRCVICFTPKQSDFSSLYNDKNTLNEIGIIFQELVQSSIMFPTKNTKRLPKLLCKNCEKQIKMYHRFKKKVIDSYCQILKTLYSVSNDGEISDMIVDNYERIEEITVIDAKTENETAKFQIRYLNDSSSNIYNNDDENDIITSSIDKITRKSNYDYYGSENTSQNDEDENDEQQNQLFCHICEIGFDNNESYELHRTNHHAHSITCQICYRVFNSDAEFDEHVSVDHRRLSNYICKQCKQIFPNTKDLLNHQAKEHTNKIDLLCQVCGKTFPSKFSLMKHSRFHSEERKFPCDVCGKRFRSSSHRSYHRYSHMDKQFKCKICHQMYSTPRTLSDHMKYVHDRSKPYTCDICNKSFQRKSQMIFHRNTHSQ